MTTFSQIVDDLIAETRRPDMKRDIAAYVNQTIRDVHFGAQHKNLLKFNDNLTEVRLLSAVDDAFIWPIVQPQRFAKVEAVFYPTMDAFASERRPSAMHTMMDNPAIWYRSGQNLVFSGFGGNGSEVLLAYFEYPRKLVYYPTAQRPCQWDVETQAFTYADSYLSDPALAEELSTNWLLLRWENVILEGGRAKIYKKLGDESKMRPAFSAWESGRSDLAAAETFENQILFAR